MYGAKKDLHRVAEYYILYEPAGLCEGTKRQNIGQ